MPPLHDIAHLAHVEVLTDKPEECLDFYVRYLGMTENGSTGDSVFLRAWDDYENTTIKLTAAPRPGVGRTNFRASSPEALQRRVAAIEATGLGKGWQDGDPGYGPVYVFTDPDGHEMGVYYETEWYRPEGDLKPALKNQAQAYPGRGVSVRRIDHINYLGVDPVANRDFAVDVLGGMVTEQIVLDDGVAGSWTTFTNKGYDAVWTRDNTGTAGRLHHLSFAVDSRDDVIRAADLALEHGIHIETGPHKHTIQQSFFLYVWDPAGNRIELDNPGARLVFAPDWQPIDWSAAERAKGQAWGLQTISTFHTHGTPPVGEDQGGCPVTVAIAVLGLGEAGSEIARDLVAAGADVRGYDPKGFSVDGVAARDDEADAVRDADLVLSVNSSHDAMTALTNAVPALRPGTVWADLNTASPGLKAFLEQAAGPAAAVVDVALMSPVPGKGLRTPMLVSGAAAERYAQLLIPLGAEVTVQPGPVGEAISRKLLRSVFYKGLAASVVEALAAAEKAGCADWLAGNISAELAGFDSRTIDRLVDGTHRHARRRADEMAAATEQLTELGVAPRISAAARDLLVELRDAHGGAA